MEKVVGNFFKNLHDTNKNFPVSGIPSLIKNFDILTRGLLKNNLYILCGEKSCYKTSLMLSLSFNMSVFLKYSIKYFSLDSSQENLVMRSLFQCTNCDIINFPFSKLSLGETRRLWKAGEKLKKSPIEFFCSTDINLKTVGNKCSEIADKGICIVDYLQLLNQNNIGETLLNLKIIAEKHKIPVLVVNEIDDERNIDKTFLLKNGCDVIMLLKNDLMADIFDDSDDMRSYLTLEIFKNRNGNCGSCKLFFNPASLKFYNSDEEMFEDEVLDLGNEKTC